MEGAVGCNHMLSPRLPDNILKDVYIGLVDLYIGREFLTKEKVKGQVHLREEVSKRDLRVMTEKQMKTKEEVKSSFQVHAKDTGSFGVQVALFTQRIQQLTQHLINFKKDHSSRRGLVMLVNKRRRLLEYAKRKDPRRYETLIKELGLRH